MSLTVDYRPDCFEDFYGNELVIKSLKSHLKKESPPIAYMFHGPPGVGKTTLARIMAKAFGCTGEFSVSEHNAANTTGVDHIRNVSSELAFKVIGGGKRKAHIFDECAGFSSAAQAAVLKDIENPALKGVMFFFCTTSLSAMSSPLKQRCSVYPLSLLIRYE